MLQDAQSKIMKIDSIVTRPYLLPIHLKLKKNEIVFHSVVIFIDMAPPEA